MAMDLMAKTQRAAELARQLSESIAIRKAYGLSMDGTVTVQKIKPSGATMRETHKHVVRIMVDGELKAEDTLHNYEEVMRNDYPKEL